jgi:hypothetical protein
MSYVLLALVTLACILGGIGYLAVSDREGK